MLKDNDDQDKGAFQGHRDKFVPKAPMLKSLGCLNYNEVTKFT
jgi:hypothetical protein